jgi:hypothetical protein
MKCAFKKGDKVFAEENRINRMMISRVFLERGLGTLKVLEPLV